MILAYFGIPIAEPDGTFIGALCHYDVVPRDAGDLDQELLLEVASALVQSGKIPPYPHPATPAPGTR